MEFMVYFTACWPIFQESTGKGLCFFVKVKNKPEILIAMSKFKWVCCYMQDLGDTIYHILTWASKIAGVSDNQNHFY